MAVYPGISLLEFINYEAAQCYLLMRQKQCLLLFLQ